MSLTNFTFPFGAPNLPSTNWVPPTLSPLQTHATAVNSLLYGPEGHQNNDQQPNNGQYYPNDPYAPPDQQQEQPSSLNSNQRQTYRHRQHHHFQYRSRNNNYLPPSSVPKLQSTTLQPPLPPQPQLPSSDDHSNNNYLPPQTSINIQSHSLTNFEQHTNQRTYGENTYTQQQQQQQQQNEYDDSNGGNPQPPLIDFDQTITPQSVPSSTPNSNDGESYVPPTYTRVQAGQGSKTQVHAVLDYDNDEYYDQENVSDQKGHTPPTVTPIQGPIFVKNGSVPVVPLFSYPTLNNGSFVQIPIWWTALSVALGLEIRGDVIKGTPCVKRYNQLFCPTAGDSYPIDRIEEFIDENKALMRRMYGDFQTISNGQLYNSTSKRKRDVNAVTRPPGVPDIMSAFNEPPDVPAPGEAANSGDSFFDQYRGKRQSVSKLNPTNRSSGGRPNRGPNPSTEPTSGRVDACESKIEIVTPYWASNSAGKIRAIVNTQHFEQAIHQEVCTKMQTSRCGGDCGCEQKYKWHRLLAYDPDNDCKGIFMDWFLFPSCCVCRCNPN